MKNNSLNTILYIIFNFLKFEAKFFDLYHTFFFKLNSNFFQN